MEQHVDFLFLNQEDMIAAGVLDAERCVDTVRDVMTLLSEGDYLMGGKEHNDHGIQLMFPNESPIPGFPLEDAPDRRFMSMPAYLGGRFHMAGEKWYGSNGRNRDRGLPRSILMVTLNDVETGQPLCYLSANLLSSMRTGAMPGLTASLLARPGSRVLALLGAGNINQAAVRAILAKVLSVECVRICGKTAGSRSAQRLAELVREQFPGLREVKVCANMEEAVTGADIVSEAVSVPWGQFPELKPEWIAPGALVISSGTMDLNLDFIRDHMTKVVDNIGMYEEYVKIYQEYTPDGKRKSTGTPGIFFCNMIADGEIARTDVRHLGDIIRGLAPGRTSDEERILVSLGGMPILDVGWGCDCYRKALELGIGTRLRLW